MHAIPEERGLDAREPEDKRRIILSSTFIATTAVLLSVQLHEYAHAVAAVLQGGSAQVYGALAQTQDVSEEAGLVTTAVAPVFSLVIGLILYAVAQALPQGYLRALLVWTGLASVMNFAGYLVIAPFGSVGDTAVVLQGLDAPAWVFMVAPVLGVAMMFGLALLMARETTRDRDGIVGVRAAAAWPWLWATLALVVIYLGAALLSGGHFEDNRVEAVLLMTIGPATALVWAPMAAMFVGRVRGVAAPRDYGSVGLAAGVLAVMVAVVAFHAFVGVSLG